MPARLTGKLPYLRDGVTWRAGRARQTQAALRSRGVVREIKIGAIDADDAADINLSQMGSAYDAVSDREMFWKGSPLAY